MTNTTNSNFVISSLRKLLTGQNSSSFLVNVAQKHEQVRLKRAPTADARVFKPKMWATLDRPERCRVRIFQQYVDRRPPEMCQEDSPFYLSINHKHKLGSYSYKKLQCSKPESLQETISSAGEAHVSFAQQLLSIVFS